MKKEVIPVPKDKCPLDVLAEMGERTKNAWIFLHQNAVNKLRRTADKTCEVAVGVYRFDWKATKEFPETILRFDISRGVWSKITSITADNIAFKITSADPEDIYFLKMDE